MKSICFFSSYFPGKRIPYYIQYYLINLLPHFSEIVLYTNKKELDEQSLQFLSSNNIALRPVENEGFDFGMWYKAFQEYNVEQYERIALVNDSCILFTSLNTFIDWSNKNKADVQGITWSESVSKHIQSYFIIIHKKAIGAVQKYFNENKILPGIQEVINTYEIGLSTYLLKSGFVLDTFIANPGNSGEYSPYYYFIKEHLAAGIPVIKKKIIFSSYPEKERFTLARMNFEMNPGIYIRLIKNIHANKELIDFEKVKKDFPNGMNLAGRLIYKLQCLFIKMIRVVRKPVKR